uniref:Sugar phosphate transporter domain-containing protein n=1 Tax=Aureoumbra lagunensis TaxID=44058 RepID=A0A7S3JTF9_9STRA|mmetsp:Transcript_19356/g.29396  ORF Transcript_19356/g.29396 Transcript_19356/m.29396 type:complete len:503 (+) Transcript_19356:40-1548(+)
MLLRRKAEAEMRLQLAKKKRRRPMASVPAQQRRYMCSRALCQRCRRSKLVSLGANFVGAISCILCNKYVMRDFDLPLTLTFLGYLIVSLFILIDRMCRSDFKCLNILPRALRRSLRRRIDGRRRENEHSLENEHSSAFVQKDIETAGLTQYGTPSSNDTSLSRRGGRLRRGLLILCTALAPALANASLEANSVGFTQLSKVLTTPVIVLLERSRGVGAPLNWSRLCWLIVAHFGVALASIADVSVSKYGVLIATINVLVTARYKVEWNKTCQDRVKFAQLGANSPSTPNSNADREVKAVSQVVQLTLPLATLSLLPIALILEGRTAIQRFKHIDTRGMLALFIAAFLGAWTSFTGYQVIGRLSALTHQILGQTKYGCLILSSYFLLGAQLNATQLTGAALTMTSILLYTKATIDQSISLGKSRHDSASVVNTRHTSPNTPSRKTTAKKFVLENSALNGSPRIRRKSTSNPVETNVVTHNITVATFEATTSMQNSEQNSSFVA